MSNALPPTQVETIAAAFSRRATAVESLADDNWRLTLVNGKAFTIDVWLDAGWLVAAADLQDVPPARYWEIVRLNAEAEPLVRFALSPGHGAPCLRAELPLLHDWDEDLGGSARHVPVLCGGFEAAMGLLDGREPSGKPASGAATDRVENAADLVALCHEAGWQSEARPGGRLAVQLRAGDVAEALLAPTASGGLRVSVDLGRCQLASAASRTAAAGLLLTATGHVRMARAARLEVEGVERARLEVVFAGEPKSEELCHALRALEIASGAAAAELKVLGDEAVAQRYILGRKWCV